MKNFILHEQKTLQFRAEFFNAFNLVNFGQPERQLQQSGLRRDPERESFAKHSNESETQLLTIIERSEGVAGLRFLLDLIGFRKESVRMKIDGVEVRVVAPQVKKYTWSHDLPQQYMTNTIIRIRTDEGVEGVAGVSNYTSHDFDRYTAETLRHLIPDLIGFRSSSKEEVAHRLRPRVFPLSPAAMAVIDIALWDLLGKVAGQPIYRLLGGARDRILAYGSTPLLDNVPAYLQFVDELIEQGFRAIKFHSWCDPDRDLELVRAVRRHHPGKEIAFMLDVENNYDRSSALRVACELEELEFTWFEAPLPDYDIEGYRDLTSRVRIPILPSGNWIQDLPEFC